MIFRRACFTLPLLGSLLISGCDRVKVGANAAGHSGRTAATPVATASTDAPAVTPAALPTPVADGSPHFNRVLSKLDVGGKILHFEDHEGRREAYIDVVKAFMAGMKANPDASGIELPEINPAALVDATGLAQAAASGRSMKKDATGGWLLRQYDYLPQGRTGLTSLLGKQPMKFRSPTMIPAATDVVVESRLDGTALPGIARAIAKACGQQKLVDVYLGEPLPLPGELNLEQLLAKTDLQVLLGVDISSWKATPTSPQPVDFILQIDGAGELLPVFLPLLEKQLGKATVQAGGQRGWELPMPDLMQDKTLLLYDDKGTLTYTSRAEYLKYVGTAAMKLGSWKEYQAATSQFPENGNLLVYLSPQVAPTLGWLIRRSAPEFSEEGAPAIEFLTKYLTADPWSFCVSCEPDGVLSLAKMPRPLEVTGGPLPYLAGTSVLFVGARAWKKGSDRAACIMNTRNTQQAVRAYENMNGLKPGDPLPLSEIFGEDKFLREVHCPLGGTYTFSKTIPKVGKLACTCSHPEHVPAEHEDW